MAERRANSVAHAHARCLHDGVGRVLAVPHERLVVARRLEGVRPVPARAAVVAEAAQVAAEEGTLLDTARAAQGVFQIRVDLDLKGKKQNLNFPEEQTRGRSTLEELHENRKIFSQLWDF